MTAGTHHHHTLAPSGQGTVVLNIGAGIGALVVHTPARLHGHEIEVSPVADLAARTHAAVRAGTCTAACPRASCSTACPPAGTSSGATRRPRWTRSTSRAAR
jgi:hypothetical protein